MKHENCDSKVVYKLRERNHHLAEWMHHPIMQKVIFLFYIPSFTKECRKRKVLLKVLSNLHSHWWEHDKRHLKPEKMQPINKYNLNTCINLARTKTSSFFSVFWDSKQNTSWCASTNSQMSNTGIVNTKNAYQICNDIVVSFNMFTNCDNL